jgi:glycosyltransferase involved in cell wall biosynthesis
MKETPLISIVMPAFNVEKYIKKAVESIINQTYNNWELIIIDDGSTDNTVQIIKSFTDKRIIFLKNKKNIGHRGFVRNLNRGLELAKGEFIVRMDSDDISLPTRIEEQIAFLQKHPNITFLGTSVIEIDENDKIIAKKEFPKTHKKIVKTMKKKNCIIHPTLAMRKNTLRYREKMFYVEDYDLYLRGIKKKYEFASLRKPLVKYRILQSSICNKNQTRAIFFTNFAKTLFFSSDQQEKKLYNTFIPEDHLINEDELLGRIKTQFKQNKFLHVQKASAKYLKKNGHYKFMRNVSLYFFMSLFPKRLVNIIRKLVWR